MNYNFLAKTIETFKLSEPIIGVTRNNKTTCINKILIRMGQELAIFGLLSVWLESCPRSHCSASGNVLLSARRCLFGERENYVLVKGVSSEIWSGRGHSSEIWSGDSHSSEIWRDRPDVFGLCPEIVPDLLPGIYSGLLSQTDPSSVIYPGFYPEIYSVLDSGLLSETDPSSETYSGLLRLTQPQLCSTAPVFQRRTCWALEIDPFGATMHLTSAPKIRFGEIYPQIEA